MKTARILTLAAITAAFTLASPGIAAQPAAAKAAKPGNTTIVGIVLANDGEFDVLQAAVIRAGLAGTLNGTDQYTVFAPTDAAFVAAFGVGETALIDVLSNLPDEDVPWLTSVLLYHVIEGRRTSTSVVAAPKYETLGGAYLTRAELLAAGIAATDISASNGIIHVINSVLIPN